MNMNNIIAYFMTLKNNDGLQNIHKSHIVIMIDSSINQLNDD